MGRLSHLQWYLLLPSENPAPESLCRVWPALLAEPGPRRKRIISYSALPETPQQGTQCLLLSVAPCPSDSAPVLENLAFPLKKVGPPSASSGAIGPRVYPNKPRSAGWHLAFCLRPGSV